LPLVEQAALAPARLGFHQHQAASPSARLGQQAGERGQLGGPAHEAGLGEGDAPVVEADGHPGVGYALLQGGGDLLEVGEGGRSRLVALVRVLAQQSGHHLVEDPRYGHTQAAQAGRRAGQVLAQDLADGLPLERRPTGEALEQDHAERVEVGPLVGDDVEEAGRLGSEVAGGAHRLVAHGGVETCALGQPEVDEDGPPHGLVAVDHDVGRLHVAVQDTLVVGHAQVGQDVDAHLQRRARAEGAGAQALVQGDAVDEGLDEEQGVAVAPPGHQGPERLGLQASQHLGLMFETGPRRWRDAGGGHGLDHDRSVALLLVRGQPGVDALAALQQPHGPKATGEEWCLPGLRGRHLLPPFDGRDQPLIGP